MKMSRWITTALTLTLLAGSAFAQGNQGGDLQEAGGAGSDARDEGGYVGHGRCLTGGGGPNTGLLISERETHG